MFSQPHNAVPNDQFRDFLAKQRAATRALCDALYDYLTVGIMASENAPDIKYHESTLDDLEKAQRAVEDLEAQVEANENAAAACPEEQRPLIGVMLPMLKQALRGATEWRDKIQKSIEEKTL